MSMNYYAYIDRGLILSGQNLTNFIHKFCEVNNSDNNPLDPKYFEKELYEFAEYIGASVLYGNDAESIYVSMLDGNNTEYDNQDDFLILPSTLPVYKFADLLDKDMTIDKFIDDIKKEYGKYLPKNFDYLKYTGEIVYVLYS